MSRLFELKSHAYDGDVTTIIDLDKICWLQIEKKPRQHYQHLAVRFVDGNEWHDLMIDPSAYQLVEAYRAHVRDGTANQMEFGHSQPASARRAGHVVPGPLKVGHPAIAGAI